MTEQQAIERIARAIVQFTMDSERCLDVWEPKIAPCSDACSCWEDTLQAAEVAWNEMKAIALEDRPLSAM